MLEFIKDRTRTVPIEKVFNEIGYLDGIEDIKVKERVNRGYIKLYQFLVTTTRYNSVHFEVIGFPLVRRILSQTDAELTDPKLFCDYCHDWILDHEDHFKKMKEKGVKIDTEAQMCYELSEAIIRIIKEDN